MASHDRTGRALSAATVTLLVALAPVWPVEPAQAAEPAPPASSAYAAPLDGLTFRARIVRDDAAPGEGLGDELVFSQGTFSSAVCRRYNFAEAPYWLRVEGDRIHFLAELTSPTDGKMYWKGTIVDGVLEGTMRWERKRWYWTIDAEHRIRGERVDGPSGPASGGG